MPSRRPRFNLSTPPQMPQYGSVGERLPINMPNFKDLGMAVGASMAAASGDEFNANLAQMLMQQDQQAKEARLFEAQMQNAELQRQQAEAKMAELQQARVGEGQLRQALMGSNQWQNPDTGEMIQVGGAGEGTPGLLGDVQDPRQRAYLETMAQYNPEAAMGAYGQMIQPKDQDVPDGFRMVNGRMEVIPGGPADPEYKRSVAQATRAPDEQLVEVYDANSPTGTRMVPRAEAMGQPGKPGSGMKFAMTPEGGVTLTSGRGVGVGNNQPMTDKLYKNVEEKLFNTQEGIARLNQIEQSFRPEYLEIPTQISRAYASGKEKLGLDVSPQQRELLEGYTAFKGNTLENLNLYIKDITGAQLSEAEAERITAAMPNMEMSPTEFQSAMKRTSKNLKLSGARHMYALRNGLESPQKVRLENMPKIINQRGKALEARFKGQGMSEEQAREAVKDRLRQEFGLGV